jgi:hypothetical protein
MRVTGLARREAGLEHGTVSLEAHYSTVGVNMEEKWSGWDGAAPPPFEGEPRRCLLHPQCIEVSLRPLPRKTAS